MASGIYDQHQAAFARVSAFVVLDSTGERVATVAIKYPGAGLRLWSYVHLIGVEMVRGSAGGGGYDKTSAAVAQAIGKLPVYEAPGCRDSSYAEAINILGSCKEASTANPVRGGAA
jgi:hypothetical protein